MTRYSRLTDAQIERLAILAEECAEVQQMIGKILRHGLDDFRPLDKTKTINRKNLWKEMGHVLAAIDLLTRNFDVSVDGIEESRKAKLKSIERWLHCDQNKRALK